MHTPDTPMPSLCHKQMLVQPGCAAAGLNPHVNSKCQPCSQWLSSAATGLQPAGGRSKGQGGAARHQNAALHIDGRFFSQGQQDLPQKTASAQLTWGNFISPKDPKIWNCRCKVCFHLHFYEHVQFKLEDCDLPQINTGNKHHIYNIFST